MNILCRPQGTVKRYGVEFTVVSYVIRGIPVGKDWRIRREGNLISLFTPHAYQALRLTGDMIYSCGGTRKHIAYWFLGTQDDALIGEGVGVFN